MLPFAMLPASWLRTWPDPFSAASLSVFTPRASRAPFIFWISCSVWDDGGSPRGSEAGVRILRCRICRRNVRSSMEPVTLESPCSARSPESRPLYEIIGFIDDSPAKVGNFIHRVRSRQRRRSVLHCASQAIDTVLIATPSATGAEMTAILKHCHQAGVSYKTSPVSGSHRRQWSRHPDPRCRRRRSPRPQPHTPGRKPDLRRAPGQGCPRHWRRRLHRLELCRRSHASPSRHRRFDIAESPSSISIARCSRRFPKRFLPEIGSTRIAPAWTR